MYANYRGIGSYLKLGGQVALRSAVACRSRGLFRDILKLLALRIYYGYKINDEYYKITISKLHDFLTTAK